MFILTLNVLYKVITNECFHEPTSQLFKLHVKFGTLNPLNWEFYRSDVLVNSLKYDPDKHHRRSLRLKGYDYTAAGMYFITICAYQRHCLFGEIINSEVRLNPFPMTPPVRITN